MRKKLYVKEKAMAVALSVALASSTIVSAVPVYGEENGALNQGGGYDKNAADEKQEGEIKDPEAEVQEPEEPEKGSQEEENSGSEDLDQEQDTEKDPEPEKENGSSDGEGGENSGIDKEPEEGDQKESDDPSADEKKDPDQNEQQAADANTSEAKEEGDSEIAEDRSAEEENDEKEKATLKQLAEMISALPDVSEIEDKTEEELHQIQDQLDDIAFYMEDHELEPDEAQLEILTAVADAVNQRMIQTLDAATLEGDCGATESDEVHWALTSNEDGENTYTLTISGTGAMKNLNSSTDLVMGSATGTYPWASYSNDITEIVIEDGVTSIGAKAFIAYTNVEKVSIGKDVQEIGTGAFNQLAVCSGFEFPSESEFFVVDEQGALYNSDMTKLYALPCQSDIADYVLPDSVEVIGYNAFARCTKLETITISKNSQLKTLGFGSFAFTENLTGFKMIPETLEQVGTSIFLQSGLKNLYCADENVKTLLTSGNNILGAQIRLLLEDETPAEEYMDAQGYVWELNYPESGQTVLKSAPIGSAAEVEIPAEITDDSGNTYIVTEIGRGAFAVTLDNGAASNSSENRNNVLKSVVVPYTVTKIDEKAFYFCVELERITVNSSNLTIDTGAFNTYASVYGEPKVPTIVDLSAVNSLTDTGTSNGVGVSYIIGKAEMLDVLNKCVAGTKAELAGDESCSWVRGQDSWIKSYKEGKATDGTVTWSYTIDDTGITLTGYDDKENHPNITVPEYLRINGTRYPVVKLGKALFGTSEIGDNIEPTRNKYVSTVIVPDTVTKTEGDIFRYSSKLTKISFKSSKLYLNGGRTFSSCRGLKVLDLSAVEDLSGLETWKKDYTFASIAGKKISIYASSAANEAEIREKSSPVTLTYFVTNGGTIDITKEVGSTGFYTPVKAGYIFKGWYEDSNYTGNPITSAVAGKTYYAKWDEAPAPDYKIDTSEITLNPLKVGYTAKDLNDNKGYKDITYYDDGKGFNATATCDSDQFVVNVFAFSATPEYKIEISAKRGLDVGIHSANIKVVTGDGQKFQFKVTFEVTKQDAAITAGDGGNYIKADYGDQITLTAQVQKQEQDRRIRTLAMPIEDSVDFYCGGVLLGTAMVKYDSQDPMTGSAKLIYDTGKRGIPAGSSQTITAYYGGSGQLIPVYADIIQVMLEKMDTSIFLTADKSEMTGAGSVELNVDASLLPYDADYTISCDDPAVTILEKEADLYEAQLPDADKVYTFTVKYAESAFYNEVEDSVTVTVKKASIPIPEPTPTPAADRSESSDSDGTIGLEKETRNPQTASSEGVTAGNWSLKTDGSWDFRKTDGSTPVNEWLRCMWNGKVEWYRFGDNGELKNGWFTDADGAVYYMHDIHDGNFGAMYTGWHKIQNKWYYFSTDGKEGRKQGSLIRNGQTPDGYYVDENGAWTE